MLPNPAKLISYRHRSTSDLPEKIVSLGHCLTLQMAEAAKLAERSGKAEDLPSEIGMDDGLCCDSFELSKLLG